MEREHINILIRVYTVNINEEMTLMKLLSVFPNFSLFFNRNIWFAQFPLHRFFISELVQLLMVCICVIAKKNTVTATFT